MLPRRARRAPAAFHRSVAAWSLFRLALASSLHGFLTCVAQLFTHLLPRLKGLKERDGESHSVTRNSGPDVEYGAAAGGLWRSMTGSAAPSARANNATRGTPALTDG